MSRFTLLILLLFGLSMTASASVVDPNQPQYEEGSYPEPPITYTPNFPPLGQYSIPNVAKAIHDENSYFVTLQSGETLNEAGQRLKMHSLGVGGIIKIPWYTDTVQCDSYYPGRKRNIMDSLSISGELSPTGIMPRFYCRRIKMGGLIPREHAAGVWMQSGARDSTLVEQIEVDGYAKWWAMGNSSHTVVRNSYFHNATSDGFTTSNIYADSSIDRNQINEFAGNEISHGGQGNTKHCLYIHRSYKAGVMAGLVFVDNDIHSCNWSSSVKSIANVNYIYNNRFSKYRDVVGETGEQINQRRYSQSSVDVAACSFTVVFGNTFDIDRPADTKYAKNTVIGVRNRKSMYGCSDPAGWVSGKVRLEETGKKHECARNPFVPECQLPDSEFWNPDYWASLNKRKSLPFFVVGNTFNFTGEKLDRVRAVVSSGTYPNYTYTLGGWACPLEAPEGWYERSMTYIFGNTFNGISKNQFSFIGESIGWGNQDKCLTGPPTLDLRDYNLITVGPNEVFNP